MKFTLAQSISLLPALLLTAKASPLVSFASYYYENCTTPSITAANVNAGACVNVENFPIQSFTAYVFSGSCDEGTSPVLYTYTESGCESGLFSSVDVDSEKQCFEADTTLQSLSVECV